MIIFDELLIAFDLLHSSGVYVYRGTFIRLSGVVLWHKSASVLINGHHY
ncbi:hypothetical protein RM179_004677 [Escherichia coli]|uniref:Uncharacterized protein n=1 Tax=Escherichia coli O145:H28 (strain RM12581) TaxID=1248823 RepID=A0ABC7ZNU4_ECOLR|nr:hypothetical protein [Escherichia coli]AHG07668.1 hypothetical protein ECRM13514_0981 [Escherichia coli O145:H28 str. RM13514]AHY69494.1 hypothetical protein ECRM12581_4820 [Escherichia coli O145:H28 str. RM12581]EDU74888.1 hypothetical protein ECH7EC4401_4798 [Escherichia coli O157:H7 str. EC4401]EGD62550.1 hypothetical protein ECF_04920 [Escherichia coli O157:H7 str. 1125]EHU59107.1 hypothetical protein ECDEC3A_2640 [Escherichia coli DEC3A]EHU69666.1 hypothetical protein ECDEC3C_3389 [Es